MKKIILEAMAVLIILSFVGCRTTGSIQQLEVSKIPVEVKGSADFDGVKIIATASGKDLTIQVIDVIVQNNSDKAVTLNIDKSSFLDKGISNRVIVGETIIRDRNLAQPSFTIVPGSLLTKGLYRPTDDSTGWNVFDLADISVVLCLEIEGKENYVVVKFEAPEGKTATKVGEVSTDFTSWHPLFLGDAESTAIKKLKEEAGITYSTDTWLENIEYEAKWSPLSLALYLNMFGYVQKGTATADVYTWK